MSAQSFELKGEGNPVPCLQYGTRPAALIFTHGAGGDLTAEAMVNFCSGFVTVSSVVCFKGNMNMTARVKGFRALLKDTHAINCEALGGRSMGARAAVMAATKETKFLVLASYPLRGPKGDMRDQILLEIPEKIRVLFISGDHDSMCNLDELNEVRRKMKCQTWLGRVRDADHGMNVKPKKATKQVGMETGRIAAEWLRDTNSQEKDFDIVFNEDEKDRKKNSSLMNWLDKPKQSTSQNAKKEEGKNIDLEEPAVGKGAKSSAAKSTKKRPIEEEDIGGIRRSSRLKKS